METTSKIRKEVSKSEINVSRVYSSDYQKEGTLTAELKQTIKTTSFYPSKSVSNSLNGNIFGMDDFGFKEEPYENSETRVAWIDVPIGSTPESVVARMKEKAPGATLYRILSNKPIIADTEQNAIDNPELPNVTLDTFAGRQAVRYPENHPQAGQLALDKNGKIQYRRIAFSAVAKEDTDLRTEDASDFYASASLKAELNNTVHIPEGQSL